MDAVLVDGYESHGFGPEYALETEDLDLTVLAWPEYHQIQAHVNSEVDVVMLVLSGQGTVTVDEKTFEVRLGSILVIPKGAERSVESRSVDFRYVNVHKRRKRLMPIIH